MPDPTPLTFAQLQLLDESIIELGLPLRTVNTLEQHKICTVRDLLNTSKETILGIQNFGLKTVNNIFKCLANFGFITTDVLSNEQAANSLPTAEDRRRRIRDALGGNSVSDWDTRILYKQLESRKKTKVRRNKANARKAVNRKSAANNKKKNKCKNKINTGSKRNKRSKANKRNKSRK